jgi:16S rRNA (guanine966-N2)-methyltransferase
LAAAKPNRVRVIGGRYRGRPIRFPAAPGLRPTPDRVRETLFNWLGQELSGRIVLDLYAGSGALSLEALSRGAALAVAVDRNAALVRALGATAREWGAEALETHVADARSFLSTETRRFDIVFLDPPFGDDPWPWLLAECVARLLPAGVVYAEAARELEPPVGLTRRRHARAGRVHYHLLQVETGV